MLATPFDILVVRPVVVLQSQSAPNFRHENTPLFQKHNSVKSENEEGTFTYSFAKTPLKAAQAPLAMAKKIHWVRTLHESGDPTRNPLASTMTESAFDPSWPVLRDWLLVVAAGGCFFRSRAMFKGLNSGSE